MLILKAIHYEKNKNSRNCDKYYKLNSTMFNVLFITFRYTFIGRGIEKLTYEQFVIAFFWERGIEI